MWHNRIKSGKTSPDFLSLSFCVPAFHSWYRIWHQYLHTCNTFVCQHQLHLKKKQQNLFQGCNHGNRGSLVKRTVSDRKGSHGLSLWQSRALTNISTCGETEVLLSIFIPTHSLFDVLRVMQRTLRSLPHRRRDCWLTEEPYMDALHLCTCSIFESSWPCFK